MKETLNNKYTIKNKEVCPFCLNRTKGNLQSFVGFYGGGNFCILKCKKNHQWNIHEFEFLNGKQQKITINYSMYVTRNVLDGKSSKIY